MPTPLSAFGVALLAAASFACADTSNGGSQAASDTAFQATVRDSAGVVIVENPSSAATHRLSWTVDSQAHRTVGGGGSPDHELYQVRGAHLLPQGRLAVVDGGSHSVKVYDQTGSLVDTWGGEGEGPGEFLAPGTLVEWPGDSVAVWDNRLRRMTVFGLDGTVGRSFPLPRIGDRGAPSFAGMLPGGRLLVSASDFGGSLESGLRRSDVTLATVDPTVDIAGDSARVLGTWPGDAAIFRIGEGTINILRTPLAVRWEAAVAGDRVVFANTDRASLSWYAPDGSLERTARLGVSATSSESEELAGYIERQVAEAPEEARPGLRNLWAEMPRPDSLPVLSDLVVDEAGYLWVKRFSLAEESTPSEWWVVDPEGRVLGRIELPDRLDVYAIGPDWILGRRRDAMDVERVEVLALARN